MIGPTIADQNYNRSILRLRIPELMRSWFLLR
nr:MAG TPA: hypothetical protein [Caudoviricetes sp.]